MTKCILLSALSVEDPVVCMGLHVRWIQHFIGSRSAYLQTSVGEHWVVESKPDNVAEDLRLSQPWPALEAYAHSFEMATLDDVTHKHVPYGASHLAKDSRQGSACAALSYAHC